jgi:hypothetical protein
MLPRWLGTNAVAIVGFVLALSAQVRPLQAQDKVASDFKAAVGLGLVGAELGAVVPAIVGVRATWAYIAFPAVGAAGGALLGYFAIDSNDKPELSVAMLAIGMGLVLPALVVTLSLTAYDPEIDAEPPAQGQRARSRARAVQARLERGPGLVQLAEGQLALSTPGIALIPSGERQLKPAGASLSLFSGRF